MAMTYEEGLRRLGRRPSVQVDKRRGTEIRRAPGEAGDHGDIQVRYRGTPVVTLHADHTYTLRTGGTASKTVIRRIAEYSPISLLRRGNGFFIEDIREGKLVPFLEGMRVDQTGRLVQVSGSDLVIPVKGSKAPLDEERLRAFIRQVVVETIADTVIPRRETVTPVTLRARVTRREEAPSPTLTLEEVNEILAAHLPKDRAVKVITDLHNSFKRGRTNKDQAHDLVERVQPPTPHLEHAGGARCDTCGCALVAHYDGANRYRGCDYALKHNNETRVDTRAPR